MSLCVQRALALGVSLGLALGLALALGACAAAPPRAAAPTHPASQPASLPAPPPWPWARELPLAEWLPEGSVLAARIDVAALREAGPLPALLEAWLGAQAGMLERARRVLVGVLPLPEADRVVLVVEADEAPAPAGQARWTQLARDAWASCVRACGGAPEPARAAVTRSSDVRSVLGAPPPLDPEAPRELVIAHAGELLDEGAPGKRALRDRLLDTSVGVASELAQGSFRVTRSGAVVTAELHARFTSRGVASSASLLARGAVFEAADALERAGLTREADLLYAMTTSLGSDDMTAKLSVPLDAVPALALAWLAARRGGDAYEAGEDAPAPAP